MQSLRQKKTNNREYELPLSVSLEDYRTFKSKERIIPLSHLSYTYNKYRKPS
jgi:hypothetical protein